LLLGLKTVAYKNWATLSVWTRQLDERSIAAIGELIVKSIAEAIGEKEDECGFIGDGTATYFGVTGMLNAVGAAGVVTTINAELADITFQDLLNIVCKLPKKYRRNAKWFGEATVLGYLLGAKDQAGNQMPLAQLQIQNGEDLPGLINKPTVEVPCMPDVSEVTAGTKFLIFGSVGDAATICQRSDMIVERSTEFGFANHTQAIKTYETKAMEIVRPGTATKVGAYVVAALAA
jgi:HK97 family phage major capsid protein